MEGTIRGYHVYQAEWTARIGETLSTQVELGNPNDVHAVTLNLSGNVVGHVPKKLSRIFHFFILRGGTIEAKVVGPRLHASDLHQGGLDIPCKYYFMADDDPTLTLMKKLKKLMKKINEEHTDTK